MKYLYLFHIEGVFLFDVVVEVPGMVLEQERQLMGLLQLIEHLLDSD